MSLFGFIGGVVYSLKFTTRKLDYFAPTWSLALSQLLGALRFVPHPSCTGLPGIPAALSLYQEHDGGSLCLVLMPWPGVGGAGLRGRGPLLRPFSQLPGCPVRTHRQSLGFTRLTDHLPAGEP